MIENKWIIISILMSLFFLSCASYIPSYTPPGKGKEKPIARPKVKPIIRPREKEKIALSNYRSATAYEDEYYEKKNSYYAKIAIDKFEKYFILTPNGHFACLALLKKAELHYRIGNYENAKIDLKRAKQRNNCQKTFENEIKYVENLF